MLVLALFFLLRACSVATPRLPKEETPDPDNPSSECKSWPRQNQANSILLWNNGLWGEKGPCNNDCCVHSPLNTQTSD